MKEPLEVWLNGNSLVLVSGLSAEQAQCILDVQLFAWLKARDECPPFDGFERWQALYQSGQSKLGCVFVAMDSRAVNEQDLQPLQSLRMGLQPLLKPGEQCAVDDFFNTLGQPRDTAALQALRSTTVQDCSGVQPGGVCMELRFLTSGPRTQILSSQLYLETQAHISPLWLSQAFAREDRGYCSQQAYRYVFNPRLYELIKDDLESLILDFRPRYQCKVPDFFKGVK